MQQKHAQAERRCCWRARRSARPCARHRSFGAADGRAIRRARCADAGSTAGQEELLCISEHERKTVVLVTHSVLEAVFVAGRIVVMATQPGSIKQIIDVLLRHRRDGLGQEFVGLERRSKDLVCKEVMKLGVV